MRSGLCSILHFAYAISIRNGGCAAIAESSAKHTCRTIITAAYLNACVRQTLAAG